YCKAKAEPAFRFYLLYDKICREDILRHAYALARGNAGTSGMDGVTFKRIEASGVETWLAGLREELVSKTYRPDPVRRATIPKPGGGERPLGIPTIRDRVVQTAAKIVLEPIFEADFEDSALWLSAAPRRGRRRQGNAPAALPGLYRRCRRRCLNRARPVLCGGRPVMGVPTAILHIFYISESSNPELCSRT